jgi:hypothetical protein
MLYSERRTDHGFTTMNFKEACENAERWSREQDTMLYVIPTQSIVINNMLGQKTVTHVEAIVLTHEEWQQSEFSISDIVLAYESGIEA